MRPLLYLCVFGLCACSTLSQPSTAPSALPIKRLKVSDSYRPLEHGYIPKTHTVQVSLSIYASFTQEEQELLDGQIFTLRLIATPPDGNLLSEPSFQFEARGALEDTFVFEKVPDYLPFRLALSPILTLKKTPTCDGTAHITQIELKPKQYSVDSDGKLDATLYKSETQDLSVVEKTGVHGQITTAQGEPQEGATVTLKAYQREGQPCYQEVFTTQTDAAGQYHFGGIFAGIAYTLSATHGTQHTEKIVVFKSNKQGDPDANRHNLSLAGA